MMLKMNVNELQPLIVEIFDLSSGREEGDGAGAEGAKPARQHPKTPQAVYLPPPINC